MEYSLEKKKDINLANLIMEGIRNWDMWILYPEFRLELVTEALNEMKGFKFTYVRTNVNYHSTAHRAALDLYLVAKSRNWNDRYEFLDKLIESTSKRITPPKNNSERNLMEIIKNFN